jgi:hypothetical protein
MFRWRCFSYRLGSGMSKLRFWHAFAATAPAATSSTKSAAILALTTIAIRLGCS